MGPWHADVSDSDVLVVTTAQLVDFFPRTIILVRCKQIDELARYIIAIYRLQQNKVLVSFDLKVKECVFTAAFGLKFDWELGLTNLTLEGVPEVHFDG